MHPKISIIIPTYQREQVLVDTIKRLLSLPRSEQAELILVDQSLTHEREVEDFLSQIASCGRIEWMRLEKPSITHAMNQGAAVAKGQILLYLDDDIIPDADLLSAHLHAYREKVDELIAGRVLQPWHGENENSEPFTGTMGEYVSEFIGCNFSIPRLLLIELGGFDENFKGAAYRYEREFADRLLQRGYRIRYEPSALIHHLHYVSGGTRSKGDHLTSWNPRHPVGAYYYLLRSCRVSGRSSKIFFRLIGCVKTRHHLRKPWYIPVTLSSELLGLIWACWLYLGGPALPLRGESENV